MSLYSAEMGDHLGIIIFSSILLILLNSLKFSLRELYKTPPICSIVKNKSFRVESMQRNIHLTV